MAEGRKDDAGKLAWHLLRGGMTPALEGVIQVLMFGAKKYAADSWQEVENAKQRYRDALDRHLAAQDKGEEVDGESGLPHAYHVACNALFLAWFEAKETPAKKPWFTLLPGHARAGLPCREEIVEGVSSSGTEWGPCRAHNVNWKYVSKWRFAE